MQLPSNDYILLSVINTLLRDKYSSLALLCEEEDAEEGEIISRLSAIGYSYDGGRNAFIAH